MYGLVDGNNFFVSCERVVNPSLEGKAVAVLSNNDGCCVSRSNEFKAKGIPMGTPYFQLKDRERTGELVFCSSNYELYGDISRRIVSILRDEAVDVMQYSIDEAFVIPPDCEYLEWGRRLREKILRWTGIPCGVGFAPTKTLAKIANHIGKKSPGGVFVMEDSADILAKLDVGEVWGVGRRLVTALKARGIWSARDLAQAREDVLRAIGGVTLLRTAMELRGIDCVTDRDYDADPDSVTCSRSFGTPIDNLSDLSESIATFVSQGAEKLRRHGMLASGCNVYAQYGTACNHGYTERTAAFDRPTDATNLMLTAVRKVVSGLFVDGLRYRKSGVVFFGLEKPGRVVQEDLFAPARISVKSDLFGVIDRINRKIGRGTVFSASEGMAGKRSWEMKRGKLSPRATTKWSELLVVS